MTIRNALTVDVEEWFHICGVPDILPRDSWDSLESRVEKDIDRLLDLFDRLHLRATFFVLGYVAKRHPTMVRTIATAGHEVASHGTDHRRLYEMTPDRFREDLRRNASLLEELSGKRPAGFRAPEWSLRRETTWALPILIEEGFLYDSSMTPVKVVGDDSFESDLHLQQVDDDTIVEFPPLSKRYLRYANHAVPLGCGWGLRFIRNGKIRRAILHENRRGIPACLVVHPWELDPDPVRIALPRGYRFVHYARLPRLRRKLPRLLAELPFASMGEVIADCLEAGYFANCAKVRLPPRRSLATGSTEPTPRS